MKTSLDAPLINQVLQDLRPLNRAFAEHYPGEGPGRQPAHTVYGGAHLFRADSAPKLGAVALKFLDRYAPDPATLAAALGVTDEALATKVYARVVDKLRREPVEDFRIDFEDGYGHRSDDEEDGCAVAAAGQVAQGMAEGLLPPFIGIRIKPFTAELYGRSCRTLDLFLTELLDRTGGRLPSGFVVTLPKVVGAAQVSALVELLARLETGYGLEARSLRLEFMVETTQSIIDQSGRCPLPSFVTAAAGRASGAHFGVYDYTASCGITAAYQAMRHPCCDQARLVMQQALAGTGVWLSDGATNVLPVPPNRPPEGATLSPAAAESNRRTVHQAWRLHYDDVRHSLATGFYQGWDLHPAQLVTRYAALYAFFLEGYDSASARLANFIEQAARATLVGDVFDDAATGQALLNYFLRGLNCGAITPDEALATGLTREELASRSFRLILERRRGG